MINSDSDSRVITPVFLMVRDWKILTTAYNPLTFFYASQTQKTSHSFHQKPQIWFLYFQSFKLTNKATLLT